MTEKVTWESGRVVAADLKTFTAKRQISLADLFGQSIQLG
jgi:hypothetical protein